MKKVAIIMVVIGGLAAVAAAVALPRLLDPDSYRGLLIERARQALNGREIELGEMSLSLWPGGLRVTTQPCPHPAGDLAAAQDHPWNHA